VNPQFKKGVLEIIVLEIVHQGDRYGYELITEVSKVVDVEKGTIYPLLKRMTNDKLFTTYLMESNEGPPRKYYKLTTLGEERLGLIKSDWELFSSRVNDFLKGSGKNE
jgi:PadR family transcriptional regulator PadR